MDPVREPSIAVIWQTRACPAAKTLMAAAPNFFQAGPTTLPVVTSCVAVVRQEPCCARRGTAAIVVGATPVFLVLRPSFLPIKKASMAVIWKGRCQLCRRATAALVLATPGLLQNTPAILPVVKACLAVVGCCRRAAHTTVPATPKLLCWTPAFVPVEQPGIAVERKTSCRYTAYSMMVAAPSSLVYVPQRHAPTEAVEGFACRRVRTSTAFPVTTPFFLGFGPCRFPVSETSIAVEG